KVRKTKKTSKKDDQGFPLISKQIVSLDFNEAEIRDVLRVLAVKTGVNIVYGDDVIGTVTIHLDDVPFDDALSMILKIKGFVIQKVSEKIFRVITPELLSQERNKAVTFTKIFTLNYGTAEDIKTQLAEMKGSNSQTIIGTDTRTNKLIVTAIPEVLENFERLIKNLDVKPSQVLIEAKIMKVRRSDVGGLGVDWSFTKTLSDVGSDRTDVMGEAVAPGKSIMEGGSVVDLSGQPVTSATGAGTGVALPVLGGGVVTFGSVSDRMAINLALSAMQDKGKSKVLACPKVATLNNEEARILIGQKVPFVTTRVDASGIATQTTEFIDVGTRLVVTPTININKMITLKIKPEKSTVDEWRDAGPVISTQEVETTVLIKDGETIVIAGLIDDRDINQNTKVPFLGDIPLLGYLFKKKTWDKERDELLIFLTPRIMYE
ncbi:type IV pilus secretin PilQ, partial [bacterium]|nr:type IV pilus secretin PilQ [bacterium]